MLNQLEFLAALAQRSFAIQPTNVVDDEEVDVEYQVALPTQVHLVGDPFQMEPRFNNVKVFNDKAAFDIGEVISPLAFFMRNCSHMMRTTLNRCRRGPEAIFQPIFNRF